MSPLSGLGNIAKLPYELREQIWLELMPGTRGDTSALKNEPAPTAVLRILRTSRDLYNEVSAVLYSKKARLNFDLSPIPSDKPSFWCNVSFNRCNSTGKGDDSSYVASSKQVPPQWRLECDPLEKDTRFDNFPFNKLAAVEITMSAPDPDDVLMFYWLWRNVMLTVELLKQAKLKDPTLIIHLQACQKWDWHHSGKLHKKLDAYTYDTVILPFFNALQYLRSIIVKPHSQELRQRMNWDWLDFASDVVRTRCAAGWLTKPAAQISERKIWKRVRRDYFQMHSFISYENVFDLGKESFMKGQWVCYELITIFERHVRI